MIVLRRALAQTVCFLHPPFATESYCESDIREATSTPTRLA
jgi:hypothetical protein